MNTRDNILFVDDELNMLSMIKRAFFNKPYNVYFAQNGKEAIALIREHKIKVMITDLQMPEMNGIDLVEILESTYPLVVKIVLTGNHQVSNILATVNKANIFKYIVKPINFDEDLFPSIEEACKVYNMNVVKEQLYNNSYEDLPAEVLISLLNSTLSDINILNNVISKLAFMDKALLSKLSLDMISRTEGMKKNITAITDVILRHQK